MDFFFLCYNACRQIGKVCVSYSFLYFVFIFNIGTAGNILCGMTPVQLSGPTLEVQCSLFRQSVFVTVNNWTFTACKCWERLRQKRRGRRQSSRLTCGTAVRVHLSISLFKWGIQTVWGNDLGDSCVIISNGHIYFAFTSQEGIPLISLAT